MQEKEIGLFVRPPNSVVMFDNMCLIVDDLLEASRSKPMREIKISELVYSDGELENLDATRVENVRTVFPLIVAKSPIDKFQQHFVVLDGVHRLAKLIVQGRTLVKVRVFNPEELRVIHERALSPDYISSIFK